MYPVLLQIGPITIYSYGVFLALAYLLGTYIFWKEGKKQGYPEEKLLDLSIIALIGALVGGRILYILFNFPQFSNELVRVLYFWEGGFAYYGSILLGLILVTYFIRKWRFSFLQIADIAALSILAATIVAKVGSFLAGNDYGTLTKLPIGIVLTYLEGSRHPVQIYEAAFSLVLLVILYSLYKKNISSANFRSGAVFFYFLLWSNLGRFIFEFFRGDSSYLLGIKVVNVFSLTIALSALFFLYFYQYRDFATDKKNITKYFFGIGKVKGAFKKNKNEPRAF